MSTAKAMRKQNELIRQDGEREGQRKAMEDVLAYIEAQPTNVLIKQIVVDLKGGKHRK